MTGIVSCNKQINCIIIKVYNYKTSGLISSFTSRAHAVSISRGIIDTSTIYNGVNDIID